jgi:hypothetical protein
VIREKITTDYCCVFPRLGDERGAVLRPAFDHKVRVAEPRIERKSKTGLSPPAGWILREDSRFAVMKGEQAIPSRAEPDAPDW